MRDVVVVGVHTTPFQRWPERSHVDLAREAVTGVRDDAGLSTLDLDGVWFGSAALHAWGQPNIGGHAVAAALAAEALLPRGVAVVNVEAGCATGSAALHAARLAIAAGEADLVLALGVEKVFLTHDPTQILALFEGGLDLLDREATLAHLAQAAEAAGTAFAPHPARSVLLDVCALIANQHMTKHGTTAEQIAAAAAKNHAHGALNPNAQYRQAMSVEEVLADKPVLAPFTRAMCAPISDGAAAVLLASPEALARLPEATRARAVTIAAAAMAGAEPPGALDAERPSPAARAAARAYERAGLGPDDVQVAELHDATSFAELALTEDLGFCPPGQGGAYALSGATRLGGARPINTSGGLVSKGHPLGATGLAQIHELVTQLRGEAGERQVEGARVALQQNGGGLIGFEEAACAVTILTKGVEA